MNRTVRLTACILTLAGAASPGAGLAADGAAEANERPPNVLLILADDLGWGDVGFNGRKEWQTPHLDRLAAGGTVFRRWYAAGVVCAPSRAALMTGRYGIHNGVVANDQDLPAEEVTMAEALGRQGYVTALYGKWHHGKPRPGKGAYVHPMDQGFDEFFGFTDAVHAWEQFPKELWHGREMKPVTGYANGMFVDRGIDFVRRHRGRPFFLYLPLIATHFHIQAPPEDVAEHAGKFEEKDPADPVNATYAAMVTRMDKEIGRLMSALDELGLADNTIVIFSSDHGATFEKGNKGASRYHRSNAPFRGGKRTLYEGGVRVPGVVRWPAGRVPAGRTSDDPVHMTDLLPTLLAAAGGGSETGPEPSRKLDGQNLLPVWTGAGRADPQRTLFWEWRTEGKYQLAALRGDLKLFVTGRGPKQQVELFDLRADPGESHSVLADHGPLADELRRSLDQWLSTESEQAKWGRPKQDE